MTSLRFTSEQLRDMAGNYDLCAADYGYDSRISDALTQAATDATTLQSLRDENARYREALTAILVLTDFDDHVLQRIARNALKED